VKALALAVLCLAATAPAADQGQEPSPAGSGLLKPVEQEPAQTPVDPAALVALEKGLAFLARCQAKAQDGTFPAGATQYHLPVPITALAALAFMAGGSTPDRGPYGKELARAVDYLVARAEMTSASAEYGYISSDGDNLSRMHGHGFATLALTQAWCMSPKTPRGERTAAVLRASVALIEKSQSLEGGWQYYPVSTFEHENSVTVCELQALRAAYNSGIQVDPKVIDLAIKYVRRCQNKDGSFRYKLDEDNNTIALTAAGMATLNATGKYEGDELERAMQNLSARLANRDETGRVENGRNYPYYERLYVAQALWQQADRRPFDRWYAKECERMIKDQHEDGSWSDEQFGAAYATASNCMVLALPLGLLPIFQR
jgi:hypothetical protein